jgi:hypothetical protein
LERLWQDGKVFEDEKGTKYTIENPPPGPFTLKSRDGGSMVIVHMMPESKLGFQNT